MSITLNHSDFQCLQDQLVDLKTKNYELAEKNRRFQADFEAAKAKICTLQLKLEEQERDFQVTSTTLRREIVAVSNNPESSNKESKDDDQKAKYKKLLSEAEELQQRYEKSVELAQQLDSQNKSLTERAHNCENNQTKLKEELDFKQKELDALQNDYQDRLNKAIEDYKSSINEDIEKKNSTIEAIIEERDKLKEDVARLTMEVSKFDSRLESQAEERKIHERKGLQIVKELKRQLVLEKNRTETLQKRLENLLSNPPVTSNASDLESRSRLSTSSSTNGNSSSNGNGSRTNQDANSVGSWSFVPVKTRSSNQALNETLSLCSIDSEDRETVQQPCDTKSENSMQQNVSSNDGTSAQILSPTTSSSSPVKQQSTNNSLLNTEDDGRLVQNLSSPSYSSNHGIGDGMLIEEQTALVDRLTRLQHDKWVLEEKLSYLEQANSSLSEDLANKSDIIKQYFLNQALKSTNSHVEGSNSLNMFISNNSAFSTRKTSFSNNVNHILSEKPSLKKVVDFLKERSQVSTIESENISREATKKMQVMLEETLIKCLKLQENLDYATSELNKLKG